MNRIYHIFFIVLFSNTLWAQHQKWERSMYAEINLENYKSAAIFKQKVNLESIDYALLNAAVFYLTNVERTKKKLKPLNYHPALEIAAWHHSKAMAEKGFFDHDNMRQLKRRTPDKRAKLAGITNPYIAENIAYTYNEDFGSYLDLADSFVKQWMNSRGHKANILSAKGIQLGCGLYYKDYQWYATQNFQWFETVKFDSQPKDQLP